MTTLIFPGLAGSGPGHWQRHWADELDDAAIVEQDDWLNPDLDAWMANAAAAIEARPGSVLVGHSLGAILIAELGALRPDLPIAGALMVAPADIEEAQSAVSTIRRFGPMPRAPLPFPAIVVASRNDPYMRFDRARLFASMWEAQLVDLGHAGHINVASGHGPWREGRLFIDILAGRHPRPFLIASREARAGHALAGPRRVVRPAVGR